MVFEEMDLNGDGAVTLEEMEGAREARFAEADANGDGVLDRDELLAEARPNGWRAASTG
jgi:Ca2+-binding EF-hand superfamily protein